MAITITQEPSNKITVKGQKLIYMASTTNLAQPNFKFLVEIPEIGFKKAIFPNPSGRLIFDLQSLTDSVRADIYSTVILPTTQVLRDSVDGCKKFTVQIGEVYDVSDVQTEFPNLANDEMYLIDGQYKDRWGLTPAQKPIYAVSTDSNVWLTDWTKVNPVNGIQEVLYKDYIGGVTNTNGPIIPTLPIRRGTIAFVNDSTITTQTATKLKYELFDIDGVQLGATQINTLLSLGSDPTSTAQEDKLVHIPLHVQNVAAWGVIPVASRPIEAVNPTWYRYEFTLLDNADAEVSSKCIVVKRDEVCRSTFNRLCWSNQWGGWDYFDFPLAQNETLQVQRKRYRRTVGDYSLTAFSYNQTERGLTEYHNDKDDIFTLRTDWLQAGEAEYLKGLYNSKQVFMWVDGIPTIQTLDVVPVTVEDNSYDVKQGKDYQVFQVTIKVKLATR